MEDKAAQQDPPANQPSSPDPELVARIQSGDTSAESELYERFSARIYYLALVRIRTPQDAEDARSETFLRVISAIRNRELRSPAALASFLMRTMDNVVLEMQRKRQRTGQFDRLPEAPIAQYFLDDTVDAAIERTLARLKPRERDFLRMYYYEELPKEEIARRSGLAGERVRLLKSRALKSFREIYLRLKSSDTKKSSRSPV